MVRVYYCIPAVNLLAAFFLLIQLLNFCSYCQPFNNILPFLLTNCCVLGRAYNMMLTYLARVWTLYIFFFFFLHRARSQLFFLRCVLSLCFACMLIASRCLADTTVCSTMLVCGHGSFFCRTFPILHFCRGKICSIQHWIRQINTSNSKAVGLRCLEILRNSRAPRGTVAWHFLSHRLLSAAGRPAWRTRCSPVHPKLLLQKGKISPQEQRMGLRRVPTSWPKVGASLRKTEGQRIPWRHEAAHHAKIQRVRRVQTATIKQTFTLI